MRCGAEGRANSDSTDSTAQLSNTTQTPARDGHVGKLEFAEHNCGMGTELALMRLKRGKVSITQSLTEGIVFAIAQTKPLTNLML